MFQGQSFIHRITSKILFAVALTHIKIGYRKNISNEYLGFDLLNKFTTGVDFINPFTLCAKLLQSAPNFGALKELLKSWVRA